MLNIFMHIYVIFKIVVFIIYKIRYFELIYMYICIYISETSVIRCVTYCF